MRLNHDVLLKILPPLRDPQQHNWRKQMDMMSLMRTCRTIYTSGMSTFLGTPIHIDDVLELQHFCDFFSDHPERITHIRAISFSVYLTMGIQTNYPSLHDTMLRKFCDVLRQSCNLNSFELHRVPGCGGRIIVAISQLKDVKTLDIRNATSSDIEVLRTLQSPLRSLSLSYNHSFEAGHISPVFALSSFKDSLEVLRLNHPPSFGIAYHQIQYPKVLRLDADLYGVPRNDEERYIAFAMLAHWFPNVRIFKFIGGEQDDSISTYEEMRHRSQQELRSLGALQGTTPWVHLDELECPPDVAYAMGLTCSLTKSRAARLTPRAHLLFNFMLGCFRPSFLDFTVTCVWFSDMIGSDTVTHLKSRVDLPLRPFCEEEFLRDMKLWLSKFPRLQVCHLCVNGFYLERYPSQMALQEINFDSYLEQDIALLATADVQQRPVVGSATAVIPGLQRVLFQCSVIDADTTELLVCCGRWELEIFPDATILRDFPSEKGTGQHNSRTNSENDFHSQKHSQSTARTELSNQDRRTPRVRKISRKEYTLADNSVFHPDG